jgi:hypothetical protein
MAVVYEIKLFQAIGQNIFPSLSRQPKLR